ncbi:hypothetical protein ASPWEDRAFT_168352 [Aspergillus wentii DTO 134E9]|uniref:Uncharacterized protein n=1 Tax=Aspergillus wentii DTO 134E9 TaxID=1073089 RepID=A0A1L9RU45_ASPWE|nr:uncharacterized protein ASPWEDRAFT_168352 [Aspergillus wentii DTO 134E9]OJJ38449.1 hypothetical protein ASPWEDRAFT_168352 [Aspergillus wentii DTO 134E9]
MTTTAQRAGDVVKSPLPDLQRGQHETKSSALHQEVFVGNLVNWRFRNQVLQYSQATYWSGYKRLVTHKPSSSAQSTIYQERYVCGDEDGVQRRFTQTLAQVMTSVCHAANLQIAFGDYTACVPQVIPSRKPDIVCLSTTTGQLKVVGEIKTPWVEEHGLQRAQHFANKNYMKMLGQIASYMQEGQVKFGFFTNYNETIFLKQELLNGQ